ncbi:hypothetical protein CFC21_049964 [Triticum aestivum]|uniref:Zinc finger GRF-type domain-containing protein n=2 Tax=Triticum aestivum TaxID=4565 RepID=A0A9R1G402_WHEAT|nr:uncharacterized protein LOC123075577 [Triticum aestivum]KAF7040024.1 hypothetical protein CFC21_049955 [Triticum aestivum]KAF7040034.1 hypothetical protein CFC21_049964 [Triticum aestivum]
MTERPVTAVTRTDRCGRTAPARALIKWSPSLSLCSPTRTHSSALTLTLSLLSSLLFDAGGDLRCGSSTAAMPSWNDGDTSSEDECDITSMDMALWETPDTTVEPLFCGQLELSEPTCMMHHMRPIKCVAFEGTLTGRRFYGCPVQQE